MGAIFDGAIEPVCENLLIPAARIEASRLIVVFLRGPHFPMTEEALDDTDLLWGLGGDEGRGAIAEKVRP